MSETVIDGRGGKFTQKRFKDFCAHVKTNDETIHIILDEQNDDANFAFAFSELRTFFETDEAISIFELFKGSTFSFKCNNASLLVDVNSMLWWLKKKDGVFTRIERLFSDVKINSAKKPKVTTEKKEKSTTKDKIYKIAAGIQVGSEIEELDIFEGDNKASVAFINNYYAKAQIRSRFDKTRIVKFVLDYTSDDDLCISTNWKTIDELGLEGLVKIK